MKTWAQLKERYQKMKPINYDELDPGIRERVRKMREAGFNTTDSGDGVSKIGYMECALPFPHVYAVGSPETMVQDCEKLWAMFPDATVEATYSPADRTLMLGVYWFQQSSEEYDNE